MDKIRFVADSNIPFAKEAFSQLGEVEVLESNLFSAERLRDCDVLLCRSTRRIDRALLDGTAVRFVATATIGFDHVDMDYLKERGIGFANAPGSNANSVSEYVTAALLVLAGEMGKRLEGMSIGVVGVGHVGTLVVEKARALGMKVIQNDPPLARATGHPRFRPIEELMQADVISLHVPLTKEGADRTWHMADEAFLTAIKPGAIFLNTSRGAVVDSAALHRAIGSGRLTAVVLDVWEGEPLIDADLVGKVAIGTPHIAGHSFDGKVNGTKMIYDAVCAHVGVPATWTPDPLMPQPNSPVIRVSAGDRADEDALREAVRTAYDILRDDRVLRRIPHDESRGLYFESLRLKYWPRREFRNYRVEAEGGSAGVRDKLAGIGFLV